MIGARDMAFPRLNAFGFWMTCFGGLLLYFSFVGGEGLFGAGSAPDVGWFAYSPLTAKAFSRGHSTDYWSLAIFVGRDRHDRVGGQHRHHRDLHALPGHDAAAHAAASPG